MRTAKSGQWWQDTPHRALANNSIAYTEKPSFDLFLKEWNSLYESKSGERGMFNRTAAKKQASKTGRRDPDFDFGCNPCSEIILRPNSFCNLTEVIVRAEDTAEDLTRKMGYATILGTLQASLTDFKYLRAVWRKNAEEEALLGVSMTGIMDHPVLNNVNDEARVLLRSLKEHTVTVNKEWASKIGINPSSSITAVKPSGTVSQLTNTASGLHPRFSKYYIRRVRGDVKDPLCSFMKEAGFPCETDVMNKSNVVFSFPIKSPDNCVTVDDIGAMKQLEHWKMVQDEYCEHKPSITVYHTDEEFLEVGSWVWKNFDDISGISFLPKTDHVYKQAPYEAITEEKYNELMSTMPTSIDWEGLAVYETEDRTTGAQELACASGVCDISDFGTKSKLT
jgi:ribonucleoside-diphosphate reductase alpha chain